MTTRIGLVGTESSHVDHMLRYTEHLAGGTRIVLAAAATRDVGVPTVDAPEDLLGNVDAVIVTDRDARLHAAHAVPFLAAGLPVFVDKPLAASVADAETILTAAADHDALLTSSSALRWHPGLRALLAPPAAGAVTGRHGTDRPAPRAVVATGPADPASPYAGLAFYGVHPVEMALALAPGPVGDISVRQVPGALVADTVVGTTAVTIHFVNPTYQPDAGTTPFHLQVVDAGKVSAAELPLGADYLDPSLDAFFAMLDTGIPPLSHEDMLRSVQLLAGITDRVPSS